MTGMIRPKRLGHGTIRRSKTPTGLDTLTREAIELFGLLIARYNRSSRSRCVEHFRKCMNLLPDFIGLTDDALVGLKDQIPGDVISNWNLLPEYIENGVPRPLKAKGDRPSFASLVRRVNRRADPDLLLAYLLSIGAVKRVGRRYVPDQRIIQLRRSPSLQRVHHMRAGVSLLRTLESNARGTHGHRLYQFVAEGIVPESQLAEFGQEMWDTSDQTVLHADAVMSRRSRTRKKDERAAATAYGLFISEGRKLPSLLRRRPRGEGLLDRD